MGLFSKSKLYIILVIILVIVYLSKQMEKNKYRKDDCIFLAIMLGLALIGFLILPFAGRIPNPIVKIVIYAILLLGNILPLIVVPFTL